MSGMIIFYMGIGIFAVSFVLEIVLSVIFRINRKKTIKKIYEGYDS